MKPLVWLVDDLGENRKRFEDSHRQHFSVRVFKSPTDVLDALQPKQSHPDVLLCDIYFYDEEEVAKKVEAKVQAKAAELHQLGEELGAEGHQTGIQLIEAVRHRFKDSPPFPIYAYTSKGPYLLQKSGFDQLNKLQTRWLFKNRYNSESEALIIKRGIEEFRRLRWARVKRFSYFLLGVFLTWLVERILDGGLYRLVGLIGG